MVVVAFYSVSTTEFFESSLFEPYLRFNAHVSGRVLGWIGYEVHTAGSSISSGGFSVNVARGCDASEPSALFVAAMVAFPAPFLLKLCGIFFGLSMLAILNVVRIVSLFLVGVHIPALFHTMHTEIWQVLFIAITMVLFLLWLLWATRVGARTNARA